MKVRLEGTSTIQYLVLRMRIHTRGWHAITQRNNINSINLRHIHCIITNNLTMTI